MSTSTLEWHATVSVPYLTLLKTAVRSLVVQLVYSNPLVWNRVYGKRNAQADVEGPVYVIGSPDRQIETGKAVMAPAPLLKQFHPFLATVRVVTPEGNPVPGVELDWWQADSKGEYYIRTYTLRGRVTTDENGYAEILTVAPDQYGISSGMLRAAHFHIWIHAPKPQPGETAYDDLTTQLYVCEANHPRTMEEDFVNSIRKIRLGNMLQSWSIPDKDIDDGRPYKNFPELESKDVITRQRVEWWNAKLAQIDEGLKIVAGATTEVRLNAKKGWF